MSTPPQTTPPPSGALKVTPHVQAGGSSSTPCSSSGSCPFTPASRAARWKTQAGENGPGAWRRPVVLFPPPDPARQSFVESSGTHWFFPCFQP